MKDRNPPIKINTLGNYLHIDIRIPWDQLTDPRFPNRPLGPDGFPKEEPQKPDPAIMQRFIDKVLEVYHRLKNIRETAKAIDTRCQTVRRIVNEHESRRKQAQRQEDKAAALDLIRQGIPLSEVARITGKHRETLKRWHQAS